MNLPRRLRFIPLSVAGALALFIVLWRMDFPKPANDDLFYCGAAINLAGGGNLSNPLLVRQGFSSQLFFVYPPLHSYALASWLKLFGVSAASLTGFQAAMYVITAAATIFILRRFGGPVWLEWLVPLGVCTAFMPLGLRPEAMAGALIMAGFAMLVCSWALTATLFGFLLIFFGASAAPRMAPLSVALTVLAAYRLWKNLEGDKSKPWKILAPMAAAFGITTLVFLVQIHFCLGEFWHTFSVHAHERVLGSRITLAMQFLFAYPDTTQLPLLLLLVEFLFFACQRPGNEPTHLGFAALGGLLLAAAFKLLGHGSIWFGVLAVLVLAIPVLNGVPRAHAKLLKFGLAGSILFANIASCAQIYGTLRGKIDTDPGRRRDQAFAMRSTPDHSVLVDNQVARYLFDYRLPAGFIDARFAGLDAEDYASQGIREGDVVLCGPETVAAFRVYGYLRKQTAQWRPLGLPKPAFDTHPRRVYVLTSKDCELKESDDQ